MKKYIIYSLLSFLFANLFANETPIKELLSYPLLQEKTLIYGTGFEEPSKSIKLGPHCKYAKGEGNNGNTALKIERLDRSDVHKTLDTFISLPKDKIMPGYKYRVVVNVRGKDVRHATRKIQPTSYRFMETFYRDKKTNAYRYEKFRVVPFATPPKGEAFQKFSYVFTGVKGANAFLRLALWIDFLGTIWFDDLQVYQEGVDLGAFLVKPNYGTFFGQDRNFTIKVSLPESYKNIHCVVEFVKDKKIVEQKLVKVTNYFAKGKFDSKLPLGKCEVKITLIDKQLKKRFKTITLPVTVQAKYNPPKGAVTFDSQNRMLVDGKLFYPLGIFYSSLPHQRKEHLERLKDSPFNLIMDYSALSMAIPQDQEKITAIRKGLDQMSKYNLKIIFCLTAFYASNSNYVKKGWAGEKGTLNMTRKLVNAIKDHPALLGYYLTDELSIEQLGLPVKMRQLINHLDPYHPTFTLSNLPSVMPHYIVSGDVFMYDPYPLRSKRASRRYVAEEISAFRENNHKSGSPCWAVPQTFNWGIQRTVHMSTSINEKLETYIEPTINDMRTMMLICILDGATGIVPWNYPFPWRQDTLDRFKAKNMANYPQLLWDKIKAAATSVKDLTPYLNAKKTSNYNLKIDYQTKGSLVRAKLYKNDQGKHALVVINCKDSKTKAVITLPSNIKLESQNNLTTYLGNGKYLFTSNEFNSDILLEK
jgi:hypothetical protein